MKARELVLAALGAVTTIAGCDGGGAARTGSGGEATGGGGATGGHATGGGGGAPAGPCDDGDACTTGDTWTEGACVGAPLSCDDGDPCTEDSCDPASGCAHVVLGPSCARWVTTAGGPAFDVAWSVAPLDGGALVVAGGHCFAKCKTDAECPGSACSFGMCDGACASTFGAETAGSAGGYDAFVARYDAGGALAWVRGGGGPGYDVAWATAARGDALYVTGEFAEDATFGAAKLTSHGYGDAFVARYDAGGDLVWVRRAGGPWSDYGAAVTVLADGSVVVVGSFEGDADFGGVTLTSAGGSDLFVARWSATGDLLWALRAGGLGADSGTGVAALADGSLVVLGGFCYSGGAGCTAEVGGVTLATAGGSDVLLARVSADGQVLWARAAGGAGDDYGWRVAANDAAVVLTGQVGADATFGASSLGGVGPAGAAFVARLEPDGAFAWARAAGGDAYAAGYGVTATEDGGALVVGQFYGALQIGGSALASAGDADAFAARFGPSGEPVWATSFGGAGADVAWGVCSLGGGAAGIAGGFGDEATVYGKSLTGAGKGDALVLEIVEPSP